MKSTVQYRLTALAALLLLSAFLGCGKNNVFSWAHKPGSNSDVQALSADAFTALQNKDYGKALEYYSQILQSDPANSEAIYGYSAATLANAGLDVSSLIANLVNQSQAPANLAPAVSALVHASPGTNLLPASILDRIALIEPAVNKVLEPGYLPRIVNGGADGTIRPDNADVNLNIAFCLILRAALRVNNYIQFDTDYNATITAGDTSTLTAVARASAQDLVSAYQRIKVVADKYTSRTTVSDINDDVRALFEDLQQELQNQGIDISDVTLNGDYL